MQKPQKLPLLPVIATFVFVSVLTPLAAQDAIVMQPTLFDTTPSGEKPDTPPAFHKKWKPGFPTTMKKAVDPGYAIMTQYLNEKGQRLGAFIDASNPYYADSLRDDYAGMQIAPAKKDGRPVAGFSWLAIIYNPASAAEKSENATPRILKVAPIIITQKQYNAFPKGPHTVGGILDIDTTGAPKNLRLDTSASFAQDVRPAIDASLAQWQFAPARQNGQPVDGTLKLSFVVQTVQKFDSKPTNNTRPPEAIRQTKPVYPKQMYNSRMVGEVSVQFTVDTQGKVKDPAIALSNNPGFEQAAIDAVLKWKFKPGMVDGKPVSTRIQIPIVFNFDDYAGRVAFTSPKPTQKQTAEMPEGLRYDTPPKARGVIYPVYPYGCLLNGQEGSAVVGLVIDDRGVVIMMTIVSETAPEFGFAALAACEYFQFDPGLLNSVPTSAAITIKLEFHKTSVALSEADRDMLTFEKKSPDKIIGSKKLDSTPKLITSRKAPFPLAAHQAGLTEGNAIVEFLIDTEGNVRLPRIISSTHPSFGYIAAQTVASWRFARPMADGKATVTRARIPVSFSIKDGVEIPGGE